MRASLRPPGRGRRNPPLGEINVTPLVDVMLVLLIIFMVTAPLLVAGVPVDLPDAKSPSLPQENEPVQLSIDENRRIFVDVEEVALAGLPDKRSEEHTSELQSLMRSSYAVFCLKKKKDK